MYIFLRNNDYRYAAEQMLLMLFPEERPVYPSADPGLWEENAVELELKPGTMKLIVNRAPNGELNPGVAEEIEKYHLELAGVLPQDETVYAYDCEGRPSSQVPDDAPVKKALAGIIKELKL